MTLRRAPAADGVADSGPLARFADHWGAVGADEAVGRLCAALLDGTGQAAPPVALAPIARRLGVEVRYDETAGDGSLDVLGGHYVVRVPAAGTAAAAPGWRRSRFSVAHELSHVALLRSVPAAMRAQLGATALHGDVERLCNAAASELLMPAAWMRRDVLGAGFTTDGLAELRDRYAVSLSAALCRIAAVFGASVSVWGAGVRPRDGESMRVVETFGGAGTFIPKGLSERFLSQPVVRLALRDGAAACLRTRLAHRPKGEPVRAAACVIPAGRPGEPALPFGDAGAARRVRVALILLPATTAATREWRRLRGARPLDAGRRGPAPSPLAMSLAA